MLCLGATFAPTQKYVVKICAKEIIEADTDPKKEVLRLRLTFHAASLDHSPTSDRSKLCAYRETSQDKEEVFEGGWNGFTTPSTTPNKNLFFIM